MAWPAALGALLLVPGLARADVATGRATFQEKCLPCHGPSGAGDGPAAALLPAKPADLRQPKTKRRPAAEIEGIVTNGVPNTPMTGWKGKLTEAQIKDVVEFVRTLKP